MSVGAPYDVIVVGAGVEGSATAYSLIKNGGGRVLLLEQFSAVHSRGSSHGGSRITRRAYAQSYYINMMDEAFRMWSQIEKESKTQLYNKTGVLMFGPTKSPQLQSAIQSLASTGTPHDNLTAEQVMLKYPHQLELPSNYKGVFEKDGGILRASKAVGTLQRLFVEFGGEMLDHCQVTKIEPGDTVTVTTNKGLFTTRKLVITAGAWAPTVVSKLGVQLPFKIARTEVLYWKVEQPVHYSWENFPTFLHYTEHEDPYQHIYGLPISEYPGLLKICLHHGPELTDPDNRNSLPGPATAEHVRPFIQKHFKGVATTPSIYEACMYTESPDENPVLDKLPLYPNIVLGAGFSGHGFKLSPVVGKILAELALNLPPSYDLRNSLSPTLQLAVDLSTEKGASNWLTALPLEEHGFSLHKTAFRDALALRYGWPPLHVPSNCVCGHSFNIQHVLSCPKGGYPSIRHNELRDITAQLLKETSHSVRTEPMLQPVTTETFRGASANTQDGARLDIVASGFWGGTHERAFFDVRVFNPFAPSNRNTSPTTTYRNHENTKKRQYEQRIREVEHSSFTPLVFSSTGGLGPAASAFYKRLASQLADKWKQPYSSTIGWLRCRLSFSLLRSSIMCIRGARSTLNNFNTQLAASVDLTIADSQLSSD